MRTEKRLPVDAETVDGMARVTGGEVVLLGERLVVRPRSLESARRAMAFAAARGISFDGDRLALDRSGLCHVGPVDRRAMWIRCGAGARLEAVERALGHARLTLGSHPPSVFAGTVASWLEGPWAGRRAMDGRLESAVAAIEAVLPDGTPLATVAAPRSAAGPPVASLLLGGGGRCGLILCAVLKAQMVRTHEHLALEGRSDVLGRWLLEALQGILVPGSVRCIEGRRLEVSCPASGENEIVAIQRFRRRARELGLTTARCEAPPPPKGAEAEVPTAELGRLLSSGADVLLVRLSRESCVAVGDLPADLPRARSHRALHERVVAALRA